MSSLVNEICLVNYSDPRAPLDPPAHFCSGLSGGRPEMLRPSSACHVLFSCVTQVFVAPVLKWFRKVLPEATCNLQTCCAFFHGQID